MGMGGSRASAHAHAGALAPPPVRGLLAVHAASKCAKKYVCPV